MSAEDEEQASGDGETSSESTSKYYLYRIPIEKEGIVKRASYSAPTQGNILLSSYGTSFHTVIVDKAAGHFHREDVNVEVEELDPEAVEGSSSLSGDYT